MLDGLGVSDLACLEEIAMLPAAELDEAFAIFQKCGVRFVEALVLRESLSRTFGFTAPGRRAPSRPPRRVKGSRL